MNIFVCDWGGMGSCLSYLIYHVFHLHVYYAVLGLSLQEGILSRAFDIGCAVGRSTFELARDFDEVIGMDFSKAFIAKCQELKVTGLAKYDMTVEGALVENKTAVVDPEIVSEAKS